MPKAQSRPHLRDVEALVTEDVPLCKNDPTASKEHLYAWLTILTPVSPVEKMDEVKKLLLRKHYPGLSSWHIHAGYHRGRRPLLGAIAWPDIVSVHHLHLHVIVRPRFWLCAFKYPAWTPLMWVSDEKVMREVRRRRKPRGTGGRGS